MSDHNSPFHRAIRKYGWDNFKWEILEEVEFDNLSDLAKELNRLETLWIARANSVVPNGYNLSTGGGGGRGVSPSEETRRKISESKKGEKHPYYGKKLSPEHIEKLSKARKGKRKTKEHAMKIGLAQRGEKHHVWGKHHTEEAKRKMSHPIIQFSLNGDTIREWIGIREAERELGIPRISIMACCKGRNKTAYGYVWRYIEDSFDKFSCINDQLTPVLQYNINGEFIREWSSTTLAAKELDICADTIRNSCNGKIRNPRR